MTSLERLIDEYNHGLVSDERIIVEMERLAEQEDFSSDIRQLRVADRIAETVVDTTALSPEEIVLEKEKVCEILQFADTLRQYIGDRQWMILSMYIVEKMSYQRIADQLGVTKQAVQQQAKRSVAKAFEYLECDQEYIKDLFRLPQSQLEADSPTCLGYPYEFLMNVSAEGKWKVSRSGRKYYDSVNVCKLPEYFEVAFGDSKTVCNICKKCKRRDKNGKVS